MKNQRGFTIAEILVTTFVFSIIMTIVSAIFIQTLKIQRRGFAAQVIQENALFVLENMAKEMRVSNIPEDDARDERCESSLTIVHPTIGTINYELTGTAVQKSVNGIASIISSNKIKFTKLDFCIRGIRSNDNKQPRVTIVSSIENATGQQILSIDLQTTVSSRDATIEFQ